MVDGPVETYKPVEQAGHTPLEMKSLTYLYFFGIKQAFVNALRAAFGHESTPYQYRYTDNQETTQVNIFRNFPKRIDKLPAIIVESDSGKAGVNFLGDEFLSEIIEDEKEYYYYGGILTLNLSIHIMTKQIVDLENLMSYTALYMRYVFKEKFFQNNLTFNKIDITPESTEEIDGSTVYKSTINTKITTNFENKIAKDLITNIESIDLQFDPYIEVS